MEEYKKTHCNNIISEFNLQNKIVLELACGGELSIARGLLSSGAKKVVCTDAAYRRVDSDPSIGLEYLTADARDIPFKDNMFDFVYAVAALEHMHDLEQVSSEICRVLKPGGKAYLHGGPIWTSAVGHHVWLRWGDAHYTFNGNNPIPPWGHLLYSEEELVELLLSNNIELDCANAIAYNIHHDDFINRYSASEIIERLKYSNMKCESKRLSNTYYKNYYDKLIKVLGENEDYLTFGIICVLTKNNNDII